MEGITKEFGTFRALDGVTIELGEGEVLALLGENGAGKSTLMNVLSGMYEATSGRILLDGDEVQITNPATAVTKGVGMVHQHFMLVDVLTVFENIILGHSGRVDDRGFFISKAKQQAAITTLCHRYGLDIQLNKRTDEISVGEQQRVEIVKALYRGADILILDEPTAVLTDEEVEGLYGIIESLTSEGKSVIFISHKLREVKRVSDRVTVLRAGKAVATVDTNEVSAQQLASLMVGRELREEAFPKPQDHHEARVRLSGVRYNVENKHERLLDLDLEVRAGEIFGVAGVDGNGQSQLASLITGLIKPDSGELKIDGDIVRSFSPAQMIRLGVSHIPEDRNRMGLIGQMSIADNLVMKEISSKRFSRPPLGTMRANVITANAIEAREQFDIRCSSVRQATGTLSGGNQQKVILARELGAKPGVLVAVHPTRGLDIGAARFVHERMIEARDRGCAIILLSADLDEVLKLADRVGVMYEGRMEGPFSGVAAPIEAISMAMAGHSVTPSTDQATTST